MDLWSCDTRDQSVWSVYWISSFCWMQTQCRLLTCSLCILRGPSGRQSRAPVDTPGPSGHLGTQWTPRDPVDLHGTETRWVHAGPDASHVNDSAVNCVPSAKCFTKLISLTFSSVSHYRDFNSYDWERSIQAIPRLVISSWSCFIFRTLDSLCSAQYISTHRSVSCQGSRIKDALIVM